MLRISRPHPFRIDSGRHSLQGRRYQQDLNQAEDFSPLGFFRLLPDLQPTESKQRGKKNHEPTDSARKVNSIIFRRTRARLPWAVATSPSGKSATGRRLSGRKHSRGKCRLAGPYYWAIQHG